MPRMKDDDDEIQDISDKMLDQNSREDIILILIHVLALMIQSVGLRMISSLKKA